MRRMWYGMNWYERDRTGMNARQRGKVCGGVTSCYVDLMWTETLLLGFGLNLAYIGTKHKVGYVWYEVPNQAMHVILIFV